jgi:hypothetical protein
MSAPIAPRRKVSYVVRRTIDSHWYGGEFGPFHSYGAANDARLALESAASGLFRVGLEIVRRTNYRP